MAANGNDSAATMAKQTISKEQMVTIFNELRQQQRILASRISDIELDMKEHDLVIDVLKDVDQSRKCYRMIGGALVERKVESVLPGLCSNREKMNEFANSLRSSLETKGKELNQFRELHGILIKAENTSDDKRELVVASKSGDRQPNILASV